MSTGIEEKIALRDYEFCDYKFKSEASKAVRKRMRRAIKRRIKQIVAKYIERQLND